MHAPRAFRGVTLLFVAFLAVATGLGAPVLGARRAASAAVATAARAPYATGVRTATVVDDTRPTAAAPALGLPGAPSRTVPVTVWYPARGRAGSPPIPGAPPARGSFPVIVWAQGNGGRGADAPALVRDWATQGYVVVAPDFPVSSRARTNLDAIDDWNAQPGDVRMVLDRTLGREGIAGLRGTVDRRHVGVAGHSLGAMTALAEAFGTTPDPRVDAVMTFAGIPLIGGADVASRPLPLLLVHGDDDATIPAAQSRAMFERATGRRTLVTVAGGGHSTYLRAPDAGTAAVLATATAAFWDGTLRGGPDPGRRIAALAIPGRVAVETAGGRR